MCSMIDLSILMIVSASLRLSRYVVEPSAMRVVTKKVRLIL